MDCDTFVFRSRTQNAINDSQDLKEVFYFGILNRNQKILSNKN